MNCHIILTLNGRFVPIDIKDGHSFGVVGFSLAVARLLEPLGSFAGFLLYYRDETITECYSRPTVLLSYQAVEFHFNFRMPAAAVRHALAQALSDLLSIHIRRRVSLAEAPLVLYHQTNTLLAFTPVNVPFIVTHHGPFAAEVARLYGNACAIEAFQGGQTKFQHLVHHQQQGLSFLRAARHGVALELSSVQYNVLLRAGIPAAQIHCAGPPLLRHSPLELLPDPQWVADGPEVLHVISAASRVDVFKNFQLLVESISLLLQSQVKVRCTIFAGSAEDSDARKELLEGASLPVRQAVRVRARLPHETLLATFEDNACVGVFVCTSLYETLCITALEAFCCGLPTIIPDRADRIGAADYIPAAARFEPTSAGLAGHLLTLQPSAVRSVLRLNACMHAHDRLTPSSFLDTLSRAIDTAQCGVLSPTVKPIEHDPAQQDRTLEH